MGAEKYMELVKKAGYKTFNDQGIIYAIIPDKDYTDHCADRVYRKLFRLRKEAEYTGSWGVMPERSYKPGKGNVASF